MPFLDLCYFLTHAGGVSISEVENMSLGDGVGEIVVTIPAEITKSLRSENK